MPITETDVGILRALAAFYVLTREQIQRLLFPGHASGRSTRKRLTRLRQAGYIQKHRIPVVLPGSNGAAPVYYLTKAAGELLASYFDDDSFEAVNTRHPRGDRLNHWIALNETRMVIEQAVAQQSGVALVNWVSEWQTINTQAAETERFHLHTQLSENPPLSCSPDAGFVLTMGDHAKVFYLEQDLGTSSPHQIAARKTKGYAALADRQQHRIHFPNTTLDTFSILFITTTSYRRRATAKEISKKPHPELWLFIDQHDLTADSFLFEDITYNHSSEPGPLVKKTVTDSQRPTVNSEEASS